jgi:hypothetical protein
VLPPATSDLTATIASVNDVPVGVLVDALNLEQHFRYDAWGQFYYYDPRIATNITDVEVEGKPVGAVIISSGPDQIRQSVVNISPYEYTTQGDDILMPVNLREQAIEITLIEMRVLQKKLRAWALNLCPINPSAPPADIFTQFVLGDEFKKDAWLVNYTIGIAEIRSSGPDRASGNVNDDVDDLVLSSLTVTCPGPPAPLNIIAEGGFNESGINGRSTDMGSNFGPPDPQIQGSTDRRSPDTPPPGGAWSLKLNCSDNYVPLGSDSILNPGNGTYAIDVWIKIDKDAIGKRVIYGSLSSDSTKIEFFVDDDPPAPSTPLDSKVLVFRVQDASGNYVEARSNFLLSIGDWHNVVATWNPQLIQLYHKNDPYSDSATLMPGSPGPVGNLDSDGGYYIGAYDIDPGSGTVIGNFFFGLIDEILIYKF